MQYKFLRKIEDKNSTGGVRYEEELVELEKWAWGVTYKDGSELKQFDDNGNFHQFAEINQDEVKMFTMYKTDPNENARFDIICEDVQYFHFYRNFMLENATVKIKVYVFGWKDKKTGACSYNYIFPDDRILSSNSDRLQLLN